MNATTKTDKKYFIQRRNGLNWDFCNMSEAQGGFSSINEAEGFLEKVMVHYNDFVLGNYRPVSRTVVIIDEVLFKFKDR